MNLPFYRIALATVLAAAFSPLTTLGDDAITLPKLPAL